MPASSEGVKFREMLSSGRFWYGAEVATTRGLEPVDSPGNPAWFAKGPVRAGWKRNLASGAH